MERAKARSGASLEIDPALDADPGAEALAVDLLERLVERLGPMERRVLEARLHGVHSQRDVAADLGETRYAAATSGANLERKVHALLDDD